MDGTPEMTAWCSSTSTSNFIKDGRCTYYNRKGMKTATGVFDYNQQKGLWTWWYNGGKDSVTVNYQPDSLQYRGWKPQNQSSLIIGNVSYRVKLNRSPLSSGKGLGFEVGFNPGYFISQKLLLAVFAGYELKDWFWNTSYDAGYLRDFNANFNGQNFRGNDSIVVNKMASLVNGKGAFHNVNGYYGIMLRLPFRFAPVLKVYKGYQSAAYRSGSDRIYLKPFLSDDKKYDHDYYSVDNSLKWGVELFLFNGFTRVGQYASLPLAARKNLKWMNNILALSIYFEKLDTYHSVFSYSNGPQVVDVPFTSCMSPAFLNKYRTDYNIGLRVSYGVF